MQTTQTEARFSFNVPDDTLCWSPGMQRLYGYDDESAIVSSALLNSHKHPADLPRMHHLVRRAEIRLEPFVYEHRIITAADTGKTIVVAASPAEVKSGRAVVISGVAIEVSAAQRGGSFVDEPSVESLRDLVTNLHQAIDSRDAIGQAKGILMERYKIRDDAAFDLLKLTSQRTHRKLRDVADHLTATGELRVD